MTGTSTASTTARTPAGPDRVRQAGLGAGGVTRPDAQVAGARRDRRASPFPASRAVAPSTPAGRAPGGRRRPAGRRRRRAHRRRPTASATCSRSLTRQVAPVGRRAPAPAGPGRTPRGRWRNPRPGPAPPGRPGPPRGRRDHGEWVAPGSGVGDEMQSPQGRHGNAPPCAGITRIRFDGRGLSAPLSARYTGLPWVTCVSPYDRSAGLPRRGVGGDRRPGRAKTTRSNWALHTVLFGMSPPVAEPLPAASCPTSSQPN